MRRCGRAAVTIAVSIAVLAGGCSSKNSNKSTSNGSESIAAADVRQTIADLAASGIATFADARATDPIVPPQGQVILRFLDWQVEAMAAEASAHAGVAGSALDDVASAGEPGLSPSYLLAAYVKDAQTPGAEVSRRVMGDQPWSQAQQIVFPTEVWSLFAADVVREIAAADVQEAPPGGHLAVHVAAHAPASATQQSTGICSQVQDFFKSTVESFFNAIGVLKAPTVDTVLGSSFLTSLVQGALDLVTGVINEIVQLGKAVVINGVKYLVQPVLDGIAKVTGLLGTGALIASALRPWSPKVTATPDRIARAVSPEPGATGSVAVHIVNGLSFDEWPNDIQDCAKQANAPLPNLKGEGAPVAWEIASSQLVVVTNKETQLDKDGTAKLSYATTQDLPPLGAEHEALILVSATVTRADRDKVLRSVVDQLFNALPGVLASLVPLLRSILQEPINKVIDKINRLSDVSASINFTVVYHDTEDPTETARKCVIGTWSRDFSFINIPGASITGEEIYTFTENGTVETRGEKHIRDSQGGGSDVTVYGSSTWSITSPEILSFIGSAGSEQGTVFSADGFTFPWDVPATGGERDFTCTTMRLDVGVGTTRVLFNRV